MTEKRVPASVVVSASKPTTADAVVESGWPKPGSAILRPEATGRRLSAAASVAAQVKERVNARRGATELDEARFRQTKLCISEDSRKVCIEFPSRGRTPLIVDLSFLAEAHRLARPLAEGFRVYGVGKRQKTIQGRRSELRIGFMSFLRDKGLLEIGLEGIDRPLWSAFKQWLDTQVDSKTGEVIHPKTRTTRFGSIVCVLGALKSIPEYAASARAAFDARPGFTWDYVATRTEPRERLPIEDLRAIDAAAAADIHTLTLRVADAERTLRRGQERLVQSGSDLSDFASCAAYVLKTFPAGLPARGALKTKDPQLYRAVKSRGGHQLGALKKALYPSARDLVPLVISLAIESALNPTALFELEWADVAYGELLGEPVIRLGGAKWRASEDPFVPISASRVEPILGLTKRLTALVRATVDDSLKDRVFLFCRLVCANGRAFGTDEHGVKGTATLWTRALRSFCADHALRPFTLSQIRATIGDEVALREGIVASGQVLGHKSVRTTDAHYVSDGTRWREAEYLGEAMLLRERWFQSNGKIDPRRERLTPRMDRAAATPGFDCFDPFDSPWPTQRKGRLCGAYGMCPSCPMAAANVHDPASVALYLALRAAILAAQVGISGEAWLARYGQVLTDLDALLQHVPGDVIESAKRFHVRLPPVE